MFTKLREFKNKMLILQVRKRTVPEGVDLLKEHSAAWQKLMYYAHTSRHKWIGHR